MKNNGFTLVEAIVVVLILAALAAILFPVFVRPNQGHGNRNPCQSNLKQIGLGFLQYIQDHDEKYPPVANARAGYWAGSLQPYLKSWQLFQCPSDKTTAPKTTDYFYNARLAGIPQNEVDSLSLTLLSGDGTGDQLPLYHLSQLPAVWRKDQNSPAQRHMVDTDYRGANYAFADGHVKWLTPEKVVPGKPTAAQPTFEVKP